MAATPADSTNTEFSIRSGTWKFNGRTKLAFKDVTDGLNKTLAVGETSDYY